jgi:hypothetical protein
VYLPLNYTLVPHGKGLGYILKNATEIELGSIHFYANLMSKILSCPKLTNQAERHAAWQ